METTPDSIALPSHLSSICIVGQGKVGTALYGHFQRFLIKSGDLKLSVHLVSARDLSSHDKSGAYQVFHSIDFPNAAVFITVSDRFIETVLDSIIGVHAKSKTALFVHTSGLLSSQIFYSRGLDGVSLHPAMSVGKSSNLENKIFCLEGRAPATDVIRNLITTTCGVVIDIGAEQKAAYHLAATVASNFTRTLLDDAFELFLAGGASRQQAANFLSQYLDSVLDGIEVSHFSERITGPAARGDHSTIEQHRQTLLSIKPELLELYDLLTLRIKKKISESTP